jgi:hypothetical protein
VRVLTHIPTSEYIILILPWEIGFVNAPQCYTYIASLVSVKQSCFQDF